MKETLTLNSVMVYETRHVHLYKYVLVIKKHSNKKYRFLYTKC